MYIKSLVYSCANQMRDVKAKIAEVRGHDASTQLLICGGKTLKDEDSLSDSVAAGGFLVLMVKKVRCGATIERGSAVARGFG